ncbi:MAG: hypothetical protein ABUL73_05730 [Alphaproteobacteria bacterium]
MDPSTTAAQAGHVGEVIGQVDPLNITLAVVAIIGAFALQLARFLNRRRGSGPIQWLNDALSVGTLLLLGIIAFNATAAHYFNMNFDAVTHSNGILILIALANCMVMIVQSLWESIKPLNSKPAA